MLQPHADGLGFRVYGSGLRGQWAQGGGLPQLNTASRTWDPKNPTLTNPPMPKEGPSLPHTGRCGVSVMLCPVFGRANLMNKTVQAAMIVKAAPVVLLKLEKSKP